jgi:hypothetical protein
MDFCSFRDHGFLQVWPDFCLAIHVFWGFISAGGGIYGPQRLILAHRNRIGA